MQTRTGFAPSNSLELAYEDMGNPDDPVVLMIMGLSARMTLCPTSSANASSTWVSQTPPLFRPKVTFGHSE
jgi:hypothetical protein